MALSLAKHAGGARYESFKYGSFPGV